ncbi:MAG: N-acyl amino acid synthase FeeM domain-containing protein, partial [Planctomycetota bacterium]
MNRTSTVRRRDGNARSSRRRRASGNRLTEIFARLEREVLGPAEAYAFGALNELRGEVACTAAGRRRALALLPQSGPSSVRDLLPGTTVFIVEKFGLAVGTVSVFSDGPLGLPLDVSCRRMLDPLRRPTRRLAEIGDLALSRELDPPAARAVVLHLLKLGYLTARY